MPAQILCGEEAFLSSYRRDIAVENLYVGESISSRIHNTYMLSIWDELQGNSSPLKNQYKNEEALNTAQRYATYLISGRRRVETSDQTAGKVHNGARGGSRTDG